MKNKYFIVIIIMAIICIVGGIFIYSGSNAVARTSRQLDLGDKYISEGKYEEAIVAYNKVIEIEPKNMKAYVCLAEAYVGLEKSDNAINTLESAVAVAEDEKNATSEMLTGTEDVYISLAHLYENNGDKENEYKTLQRGYELTGSSTIADLLKKFLPTVEVSVPAGIYELPQLVTLKTEGSVIYYTLDGSEPNSLSATYSNPIEIGVGETALKVVAENEIGELGEIITYTYDIEETVEPATPKPSAVPTPETTASVTPIKTPQPSKTPEPKPSETPKAQTTTPVASPTISKDGNEDFSDKLYGVMKKNIDNVYQVLGKPLKEIDEQSYGVNFKKLEYGAFTLNMGYENSEYIVDWIDIETDSINLDGVALGLSGDSIKTLWGKPRISIDNITYKDFRYLYEINDQCYVEIAFYDHQFSKAKSIQITYGIWLGE